MPAHTLPTHTRQCAHPPMRRQVPRRRLPCGLGHLHPRVPPAVHQQVGGTAVLPCLGAHACTRSGWGICTTCALHTSVREVADWVAARGVRMPRISPPCCCSPSLMPAAHPSSLWQVAAEPDGPEVPPCLRCLLHRWRDGLTRPVGHVAPACRWLQSQTEQKCPFCRRQWEFKQAVVGGEDSDS